MAAPTVKVGDAIPSGTFSYVPYAPETDDLAACGIRTSSLSCYPYYLCQLSYLFDLFRSPFHFTCLLPRFILYRFV